LVERAQINLGLSCLIGNIEGMPRCRSWKATYIARGDTKEATSSDLMGVVSVIVTFPNLGHVFCIFTWGRAGTHFAAIENPRAGDPIDPKHFFVQRIGKKVDAAAVFRKMACEAEFVDPLAFPGYGAVKASLQLLALHAPLDNIGNAFLLPAGVVPQTPEKGFCAELLA
jgi:hypothetical protein